jgi:hypothetical protein
MAAPVKNLLTPTVASLSLTTQFTHSTARNASISFIDMPDALANVMFYNQMSKKFFFISANPAINFNPYVVNHFKTPPAATALYMISNTFPAAYTKTSIRPVFGQIWPRSGFLPPW